MRETPEIRIGTSGWIYRDWRGRFYPEKLRQADWLSHFSRQFDTTEINYSFYRVPSTAAVARWVKQVPPGFQFAIKLWRGITQYRKLKDCREFLERFFRAFEPLPEANQGPLLVQLPPHLRRNVERLDGFLADLSDVSSDRRWKVAVEFRNDDWLCDDVYHVLNRHKAALCLHDMLGKAASIEANDVPFVYVRRHGTTAKYAGSYSPEQIAQDAGRIRVWHARGKSVYVYFNNDREGHAVRNALDLRRSVTGS